MLAWVPHTDGLPHLLFVERKPEPLGAKKSKVVFDFVTGVLLHLEVKEKVDALKKKKKKNVPEEYGRVL